MREGRTEQPVFAGSVIGRIQKERKHTINDVNEICGAAVLSGDEKTAVSVGSASHGTDDGCMYAFYEALNRMGAAGGMPLAVSLNMILPDGMEADGLKSMTGRFVQLAEEENVDIADVHSSVSSGVLTRIIQVVCIGRLLPEYVFPEPCSGLSILMTKYAGCEGTAILAHEKYGELKERFAGSYLEEAFALKRAVPAVRDAHAAIRSGVPVRMLAAGEGGILSALWDLSAGLRTGLETDLRAVPVRQETVELCEAFSLNPYTLHAGGSLLILTGDEGAVAESLEKAGIPCAVIGHTRNDQKKLLKSGELVQCMNRPAKDALLVLHE